ncbi:MAG: hypothetical protein AB9869_13870 [Verrucomicrobiia bacterium]
MKILTHLLAGIAAFAMCLATAQASIVLNVPDTLSDKSGILPTSYNGFNWSGGWLYGADNDQAPYDYYVYATGEPGVVRTDGLVFDYDGADFAGAGTLTIEGYLKGQFVDSITVTLNTAFDTSTASIKGVDELIFAGNDWKMKEFNDIAAPVPEPTTILAGALLLLPFAASAARSIRKARR